jgi:hypothetical protein
MSAFDIAVPPRLPMPADQLVGHVLRIPANRCRYRDTALALLVRRIRFDISQWYGGRWVWLEGEELADTGYSLGRMQALVHVSACTVDPPAAGRQSDPSSAMG